MTNATFFDGVRNKYAIGFYQWSYIFDEMSKNKIMVPPSIAILPTYLTSGSIANVNIVSDIIDLETKFLSEEEEQNLVDASINYFKIIPGYGLYLNTQCTMLGDNLVYRQAIIDFRNEIQIAISELLFEPAVVDDLRAQIIEILTSTIRKYDVITIESFSISFVEVSVLVNISIVVQDIVESIELAMKYISY